MRSRERFGSERGAVFVQVGIAMFVLVAFNVFVVDYGVMWIARGQAQTAADAGALAGAVARSYDDFDPTPSTSGEIAQLAKATAAANLIWNLPAAADVPSFGCPAGAPPGRCVRVDVYRDGTHGSTALPTIFGPLLGVNSQGVKATAIGFSGNGNATNCLRPLAFADDWNDVTSDGRYVGFDATGNPLPPGNDTYAPPGTQIGFFGERIDIEWDRNPITSPITHGFMLPLDLGGTYTDQIKHCSGDVVRIGDTIPLSTPVAGVTRSAVETDADSLIQQDPLANWDAGQERVVDSCAPGCGAVSPRLIPVVLYDPADFQQRRASGNWGTCGGPCIRVSNIIGLFIHIGAAPNPHGHMVRYPGMTVDTAPIYGDNASWLTTTSLIR